MSISNAPIKVPSKPAGIFSKFGMTARRWASSFLGPANQIDQADTFLYGAGSTTVASLLGTGKRSARSRQIIYDKWSTMESDPIVSTALLLLVTSALGGHETNGDLVFVEKTPDAKKNKQLSTIAEEVAADLTPLFNRVAFQIAYTGAVFGDAYARIYADSRGVIDLYADEMVRPPLVQPFERGRRFVADRAEAHSCRRSSQRLRSSSSTTPRRSSSTPVDRLKHVGNLTMPRQKFLRLLALSSKTRKLERITRNERTRPDV